MLAIGMGVGMGVIRESGSTSEDRVHKRWLVMREKRPWLDRRQKRKEAEPVFEGTVDLLNLSTGGGWRPEVKQWRRQSRECLQSVRMLGQM